MVRAILDGRKTQTRRVIKPPKKWAQQFPICAPHHMKADFEVWWHGHETERVGVVQDCPYGKPGDLLWVKETWGLNHSDYIRPNPIPKNRPADLLDDQLIFFATEDDAEISNEMPRTPSIFMPRWASRIELEITGIRVERLQDISAVDAACEGVFGEPVTDAFRDVHGVDMFRCLWSGINGAESWDANPWVWVVEFKRVEAQAVAT